MLFAYTQPKLASTETVFPAMQRNIKPHCHARDEEDTCSVTMIFVLTPDDMKKSGVGERMVQLSLNLLVFGAALLLDLQRSTFEEALFKE